MCKPEETPPVGVPNDWDAWRPHLAGAIRTLLYQKMAITAGWNLGRDLDICRMLHGKGFSYEVVHAVIILASQTPGALPPPPVTMRYFWEHGQLWRFNELVHQLQKAAAGESRPTDEDQRPERVGELLKALDLGGAREE